jgi:hypothetical protein
VPLASQGLTLGALIDSPWSRQTADGQILTARSV